MWEVNLVGMIGLEVLSFFFCRGEIYNEKQGVPLKKKQQNNKKPKLSGLED